MTASKPTPKGTPTIPGLFLVTGGHGVGKTSFALECGAAADRICLVDDDLKGRSTAMQLQLHGEFAYYDFVNLTQKKRLVEIHEIGIELLDSIQPGQFDALVWDTWTRFYSTFKSYVEENPLLFRKKKEWSVKGSFKGPQEWNEAKFYEAEVLWKLLQKVPTVILVAHLNDQYINQVATGKKKPAVSKAIDRVCNGRLWLRRNPNRRPVPVGLFLKQLDMKKMVEGKGLRTICVVPPKITPRDEDESLWDTIRWYYRNPIGSRATTPEETPDEWELSVLQGTLTPDERHTFELMLKAKIAEDEELLPLEAVTPSTWQELLTLSGKGLGDLGGIGAANQLTAQQIENLWEAWS